MSFKGLKKLLFNSHYSIMNLTLIFSFISLLSFSQNLIPNPSFEQYKLCPTGNGFGEINKLENWYEVYSSADYYNCSAGIPGNSFGSQYAKTGNGYIGFANGESIGVKLLNPLETGKDYLVEFYVSLADDYGIATKDIGIHFSRDSICVYSNPEGNLQIKNLDLVISDSVGWTKISGIYNSKGCEKYLALIIDAPYSYYYFDDISVKCADSLGCNNIPCSYIDSIIVPNVFTPNRDFINDKFHLDFIDSEPSDFICTIYNRWGSVVKEISYPKTSWDGTNLRGGNVSEGVYYYFLSSTFSKCGEWFNRRGFVHLFR